MEVKDLDTQIRQGTLGSLYFFYGDEQYLLESKVKSIGKAILSPDFADMNYALLEGKKLSLAQVSAELLSVPIISEKKLIVIKNSGLFGNTKSADYKTLCELISDIPDYLCVIFTEREFDKKKEKNLDPIKKHGQVVKFDFLSAIQLERWLDKFFESQGKRILPRDIGTIIRLVGQNMAQLHSEAAKLVDFVGDREKITAEDIDKVVSPSTEARLFDVIDSLSAQRGKGIFDQLENLRASGENPSTILSLLSARMGELLMVKQLSFDKLSAEKIAGYFEPRRPGFVVNKLLDQSKKFSEKYLAEMTKLGIEYAALVRSGKLDKWIAVEMYAAKLLDGSSK